MKSFTQLVCPVSAAKAKVPLAVAPSGVFLPLEDDEDGVAGLPVGWGGLVVTRVVGNPDYDLTAQARAAALVQEMDNARKALEAAPEDERAKVDLQQVEAAVKAQIEANMPMPEATMRVQARFDVLSPEALETALKLLRDAGFPFEAA
jgi:hypothetical protein